MKPLLTDEIRREVHGRYLARGEPAVITAVTTDTRTARPDECFFAIKGENFDGHAFLDRAADAGCAAAVVRLDAGIDKLMLERFSAGVIGVADTIAALGDLAGYHRRVTPATVAAVTGSNGKTTVKRMIHHILSKRLAGTCSPKSFNNNIGVPLTLLGASLKDDFVICEVGTSAPGETSTLARIVRPDIAVITSIGPTHLEKLVSVEKVAIEKAALLGSMDQSGLAVVCAGCSELETALRAYRLNILRFGTDPKADLRLTAYEQKDDRQRFQLNDRQWVELGVPGRHNALNAIAAIGVAQRFNISQADAAAALSDFSGTEMRLEWVRAGGITIINDSYNANPSSMVAAADVLCECKAARRVFVAGDMRELGAQTEELHFRTGADISARQADLVVAVGKLGGHIARGAASRQTPSVTFDTVEQACRDLPELLQKGDVVLVKGSRAMGMERLAEALRKSFGPPDVAGKNGSVADEADSPKTSLKKSRSQGQRSTK
ncbi:MAG: UDP-N-acetylmuramoyl-tripeptide--D-alanyl-D-alanine ligase [Planctomycetes bacterium]|nr:UDP-N-acetylmuramoyl-tripeptide--D-alanyl-D-alanine ligase [Planctomycetota bacterium]